MRLWPIWEGDDATYGRLVDVTLTLVRAHHTLSSSLAAAYYEMFRRTEQVAGAPAPRLAASIDTEQIATSLHVTGRVMTRKALLAGQTPEAAMRTAFVRTSGAVTRHVLAGGRDTLVLTAREDRQAVGWARVTSGKPCAFCAMLASRGPVYREDTVGFRAHDHCSCAAELAYDGAEWPGRAREFQRLWGEHKAADNPLQSFRQALAAS